MQTNYTDTQLLRMFPVLLSEEVEWHGETSVLDGLFRIDGSKVKPTEYLELCRRIEENMTDEQHDTYRSAIADLYPVNCSWREIYNPSWRNRLIAACEVFGKEITEV